jgi:hypothetical protein
MTIITFRRPPIRSSGRRRATRGWPRGSRRCSRPRGSRHETLHAAAPAVRPRLVLSRCAPSTSSPARSPTSPSWATSSSPSATPPARSSSSTPSARTSGPTAASAAAWSTAASAAPSTASTSTTRVSASRATSSPDPRHLKHVKSAAVDRPRDRRVDLHLARRRPHPPRLARCRFARARLLRRLEHPGHQRRPPLAPTNVFFPTENIIDIQHFYAVHNWTVNNIDRTARRGRQRLLQRPHAHDLDRAAPRAPTP